MQILRIIPAVEAIEPLAVADFDEALLLSGFNRSRTEFAKLSSSIGIAVHELGLFMAPDFQHYVSINGNLFAGDALVYRVDPWDEPSDLFEHEFAGVANCEFLHGASDVEQAILEGRAIRPTLKENGRVVWEWPAPR